MNENTFIVLSAMAVPQTLSSSVCCLHCLAVLLVCTELCMQWCMQLCRLLCVELCMVLCMELCVEQGTVRGPYVELCGELCRAGTVARAAPCCSSTGKQWLFLRKEGPA